MSEEMQKTAKKCSACKKPLGSKYYQDVPIKPLSLRDEPRPIDLCLDCHARWRENG